MPWLQIRFPAVREQAQRLGDALEECGAISVSIEHVGDDSWVESDWEEMPVWQRSRVTALFPEHTDVQQVLDRLRQLGAEPPTPETGLLADEDWESSWKENYHPLQISERLWICPSWVTPPDPEAVNVILDPGMAFGTGDHPTTALCLEWLSGQDLADRQIIDYGCGSGILSIAALKLGARAALGVDSDGQALEVARRNAVLNGVSGRFQACAHGALPQDSRADIVVANILANALIALAPRLTRLTREGGLLALSGILMEQVEAVRAPYDPNFALTLRRRGEWALLAGRKTAQGR